MYKSSHTGLVAVAAMTVLFAVGIGGGTLSASGSEVRATAPVAKTHMVRCDQRARPLIEGVYVLKEWDVSGQPLTLPIVDGRYVLKNGVVVVALKNDADSTARFLSRSWGDYSVKNCVFSYQYTDIANVTETPSGTTVTHAVLTERRFPIRFDGKIVVATSEDGTQEFRFTGDTVTFSVGGNVLRVWQHAAR